MSHRVRVGNYFFFFGEREREIEIEIKGRKKCRKEAPGKKKETTIKTIKIYSAETKIYRQL